MKPALRHSKRKRRRLWAAPIVLTFALAPAGCKKAEPDVGTIETRNPPDPGMMIDAAAKAPQPRPSLHARVSKLDSGECQWAEPENCDPGDKCNPPPPVTIECPPHLGAAGGQGVRKDDGTCEVWIDVECPTAEDGTMAPCNPPPPVAVPCPE